MTAQQVQFAVWFELETCCNCSMTFYVPLDFHRRCREDANLWFYCPAGHRQHYSKGELQKLKEQVEREQLLRANAEAARDRARSAATFAENSARTLRGHLTRVKKRVAGGACPCCNRSFANLHRHMKTKHPDYAAEPTTPAGSRKT